MPASSDSDEKIAKALAAFAPEHPYAVPTVRVYDHTKGKARIVNVSDLTDDHVIIDGDLMVEDGTGKQDGNIYAAPESADSDSLFAAAPVPASVKQAWRGKWYLATSEGKPISGESWNTEAEAREALAARPA